MPLGGWANQSTHEHKAYHKQHDPNAAGELVHAKARCVSTIGLNAGELVHAKASCVSTVTSEA